MKPKRMIVLASLIMALVAPMVSVADKGGLDVARHKMVLAERKLAEARQANADEKRKLLGEHMQMMKEAMMHMQGMKAEKGMSGSEHDQWMAEHQKLMDNMLEQMMADHGMMMHMMDCK